MKNITELRNSLAQNYELMKKGKMKIKVGKELSNNASKIISTLKIELDYNKTLGHNKKIDFLETD